MLDLHSPGPWHREASVNGQSRATNSFLRRTAARARILWPTGMHFDDAPGNFWTSSIDWWLLSAMYFAGGTLNARQECGYDGKTQGHFQPESSTHSIYHENMSLRCLRFVGLCEHLSLKCPNPHCFFKKNANPSCNDACVKHDACAVFCFWLSSSLQPHCSHFGSSHFGPRVSGCGRPSPLVHAGWAARKSSVSRRGCDGKSVSDAMLLQIGMLGGTECDGDRIEIQRWIQFNLTDGAEARTASEDSCDCFRHLAGGATFRTPQNMVFSHFPQWNSEVDWANDQDSREYSNEIYWC